MLILWNRVGNDDGLEAGAVDPGQRGTGENAVGEDGVHLDGASLDQFVGRVADGAAGVGHVVHQDGHAVLGVAHEDHGGHLVRLLSLLVDQGKLDV